MEHYFAAYSIWKYNLSFIVADIRELVDFSKAFRNRKTLNEQADWYGNKIFDYSSSTTILIAHDFIALRTPIFVCIDYPANTGSESLNELNFGVEGYHILTKKHYEADKLHSERLWVQSAFHFQLPQSRKCGVKRSNGMYNLKKHHSHIAQKDNIAKRISIRKYFIALFFELLYVFIIFYCTWNANFLCYLDLMKCATSTLPE